VTYTLILHIPNSEPIVGEADEIPSLTDNLVKISNPRMRDGKDVSFLDGNTMTVIWPIYQITFIEVMTGREEEEIIGFVRE